jgi:hypothetical protein
MKRLFAILLSMVLIFGFVGCAKDTANETTTNAIEETTLDGIEFTKNVTIETENFDFYIDGAELNETDGLWCVKVLMVNKSNKVLTFNWKEVFVNDVAIDPGWASEVAEGEFDNGTVIFPLSLLAENDITDVENIKFTLSVTDTKGNILEDTEYIFSLVVTDEEETTVVEEETTIDETTTVVE